MISTRKFILSTIGFLIAGILLVFKPWKDSKLEMPFESEISPTAPWDAPGQDWGRVRRQVFDSIFRLSSDGSVDAGIIEDWSTDKEFKKFQFTVKKGIHFSDGSEMTSSDVVNSLNNVSLRKDFKEHVFKEISKIESISEIDRYSFEIGLNKSSPDFLIYLSHVEFEIYKAALLDTDLSSSPFDYWVGTGHYKIKSTSGNKIVLVPNPHNPENKTFDMITFTAHENQKQAFLEGKLDLVHIDRDEVNEFQSAAKSRVISHPILGNFYIGFNFNNELMSNVHFRRAVKWATDRSQVVENYTIAPRHIPASMIPYGLPGYKAADRFFDLEKARLELKKVPNGLINKIKTIRIVLPRSPHHMTRFGAEKVVEALARLEIKGDIIELERKYGKGKLGDYYYHLQTSDEFDLYLRGMILPVPSPMLVYEELFRKNSLMNFGKYESDRLTRMLDTGPGDLTEHTVNNFYSRLNEIIAEDVPTFPLGILFANRAINNRVSYFPNTLSPYFLYLNEVRLR